VVAPAMIAIGLLVYQRSTSRRALRSCAVSGLVLVIGAIWFVQRDQPQNRLSTGVIYELKVVSPLRSLRDSRIATQGFFLQYVLYGPDVSNHVQYLGQTRSNGALTPLITCRAWKHEINAGDYDFLLVAPEHYPVAHTPARPKALEWAVTEHGEGLRELAHDGDIAAAFEVQGHLDERSCP
jgi:hypothetical protein